VLRRGGSRAYRQVVGDSIATRGGAAARLISRRCFAARGYSVARQCCQDRRGARAMASGAVRNAVCVQRRGRERSAQEKADAVHGKSASKAGMRKAGLNADAREAGM